MAIKREINQGVYYRYEEERRRTAMALVIETASENAMVDAEKIQVVLILQFVSKFVPEYSACTPQLNVRSKS
jgi:hypothetical protein